MAGKRVFSTAEMCEMLHISKSTLFRWEREGALPPVGRDVHTDQREYTEEHIRAIIEKQLGRQYARASEAEDESGLGELQATLSLGKFLAGDPVGLWELAEQERLPARAVKALLRTAVERYEPEDAEFCEAAHIAWRESRRLQHEAAGATERPAGGTWPTS